MGTNKKMTVMVLGLRGFPEVQGGIQKHCQQLYPRIVSAGVNVDAIVRSPYMQNYSENQWQGVQLRRLWSPKIKSLEAIVHSFLGVLLASITRPDVLHIHGIGPSLVIPLARLFRLRVVMTHHGPDYDRQKWGWVARRALKIGEYLGVYCSHHCIAISKVIQKLIQDEYHQLSEFIPNGVLSPELLGTTHTQKLFNLKPRYYFLMVGRLVPEKRQLDVIKAFSDANISGWKLVLVGESNHPDQYMNEVITRAAATSDVICTGLQTGDNLSELYEHAGGFILASSHEGHSVALLEALSYGLPVIVSNIPANLDIGLPRNNYYPLGNIKILAERLYELAVRPMHEKNNYSRINDQYNWSDIAKQTHLVLASVANKNNS